MNIADAKQQVKDAIEDYLELDEAGGYVIPVEAQRPLFLLGAPGIGKTAIMAQVARELGIGLVSYSMTHHTRQSALGLPFIAHKSFDDQEFDVSEYTMSEIIASMYDHMERTGHDRGILFLDEINCVSETLYPSMLQFLQFKTFGRHRVPKGWAVVCAGNPPEYNKSVYDFDVVTLDRLRKIDVEPDLGAWLDYARDTGVHPAITTYLEVKRDQFYRIGSTQGVKTFVTARGWDDLSRSLKMAESKGRPVGKVLVGQFLQDEEAAERFASYYALFDKYRGDYRVGDILEGIASDEIASRAKAARFDERLAVMRLIADGLETRCAGAVARDAAMAIARDVLRGHKEALLSGAEAADTVGAAADALAAGIAARLAAETTTKRDVEAERQAVGLLRECMAACERERRIAGPEAFEAINACYMQDVALLEGSIHAADAALENAFAFIGRAFGNGREMDSFTTDLTARPATARFIARFGNDAYYAHNGAAGNAILADDLVERIEEFDLEAAEQARIAAELEEARKAACGSCSC